MRVGKGNMKVVNIYPPHLPGGQHSGSNRSLGNPSGLYVRTSVPTHERQFSIQHVDSFGIECNVAFLHDCVKRKQVEVHTRYIRYVQQLDLNIAVLAVHDHP